MYVCLSRRACDQKQNACMFLSEPVIENVSCGVVIISVIEIYFMVISIIDIE